MNTATYESTCFIQYIVNSLTCTDAPEEILTFRSYNLVMSWSTLSLLLNGHYFFLYLQQNKSKFFTINIYQLETMAFKRIIDSYMYLINLIYLLKKCRYNYMI